MDGYTKLFASITDSSIWGEDLATRAVWVTMLAMADQNGYVGASIDGLARRANVPIEDVERALVKFYAPDPRSRDQELDGRRVEVAVRGWTLLNHHKFRALRSPAERAAQNRESQKRYRDKSAKRKTKKTVSIVSHGQPPSAHSEAEASADLFSSENSSYLPAADDSSARESAPAIELGSDPESAAAKVGRTRLSGVPGNRLNFDHRGKWQGPLATIARYSPAEWLVASGTLAKEVQKQGIAKLLTPTHIVDHWHLYSVGLCPGPKVAANGNRGSRGYDVEPARQYRTAAEVLADDVVGK